MKIIKDLISTIDLAFLLTFSAICSYGLYFCYYWGVYSVYNLPIDFIDLDIRALTVTSVLAVVTVIIAFYLVMIVVSFNKPGEEKTGNKYFPFIFWGIVVLYIGFIIALRWAWDFSVEKTFVMGVSPFITGLLISLSIYLKKYLYPITLIILLLLASSFVLGRSNTQESEDYWIIKQGKDKTYAVLDISKEKFIIAPVKLKKKLIMPKFQVVETKSEKGKEIEWERMHTGKLKVKNYSN
ncbi:hypothetical protein [Priestia sp. P5]|uniref:hypothetical protein n=1 Tax=Priestia sp. P5 TaxID=2917806 RepID=UPI00240535DC|nr:hypothetical protein [Priestia sp. P5]MDG0062101.1 hypothetical protein [Priestia sp. P5]